MRKIWLLASVLLAVNVACGGGGGDAGGDSNTADQTAAKKKTPPASSASSKPATPPKSNPAPGVSDAQLAAELKKPPAKLSVSDQKKLITDTIQPTATTARLKMLNDFIAAGIKDVDPKSDDAPYNTFAGVMQALFWGTPRDVASKPAGFGGQTFTETFDVSDDNPLGGPSTLAVAGTASADYELTFTLAGVKVSAKIKKDAKPDATAKAIAAAIEAASADVSRSIGDEKTFEPIGGNHMDSLQGIDDVEVEAAAATVKITVAING